MNDEIMVSGFTFIKNGLTLGYPIRESIESIDPLCDEIVVNVGYDDKNLENDDGTYEYLTSYFTHPKFKFIKSWWDPELTSEGLILSQQTNIALKECRGKYCQYIQGDEVLHEDDLAEIQNSVMEMEENPETMGLIFNYIHFYGNVDIYKFTRNIYRREVRLIRNHINIISWLDAQGFRYPDGSKIVAQLINARVFHYGWARQEQVMRNKIKVMDKFYHGKDFEQEKRFEYEKIWGLKKIEKTHPKNMSNWIDTHRNDVDIMSLKPLHNFDNIGLCISDWIERLTDYRMGEFKNYKRIK